MNIPLKHELCYSLRARQHIRQILSRTVKILLHISSTSLQFDYSISSNEQQIKTCPLKKKKKQVSQTVTIYILYICVVECPSLEIFKRCLDVVLGHLFWVVLLEGWTRWPPEVLPISTILWFCEAQSNGHQNQVLNYWHFDYILDYVRLLLICSFSPPFCAVYNLSSALERTNWFIYNILTGPALLSLLQKASGTNKGPDPIRR